MLLKQVYYSVLPIHSTMGLANIGHINSVWEIHPSKFFNAKAVPNLRLKTIHRMRHPSLGNQTPLPGPIPGWKTKTHKRYISKDRSLLKTLEQAVLKSNSEARMSWILPFCHKNLLCIETPFRTRAGPRPPTSFCLTHDRIPRPTKPIPQHAHPRPCPFNVSHSEDEAIQ